MKKIAICGRANSGKNTIAKILTKFLFEYPEEHFILAFADPIKKIILEMFPQASKRCLYGSSKLRSSIIPGAFDRNNNPLSYRQALIDIGTLGRSYNDNIWINKFDHAYQQIKNNKKLLICSDLRFVNEFQYLKSEGFFIIKIIRDSITKIDNPTETNQELIETADFNYVLDNNDTLMVLKEKIKKDILPLIK